ncbi:MAG TPA: hypothetical protein DC047_14240 [Blastocatellia bacterium]|nr:hypothetical protein [Blastocatellia bacterium]
MYLPEKIDLVDDTVIIANMIIFEGRNIVIKGNHSFVYYPVEGQGVLGTALEEAMLKQGYTEEVPKFGCDAFNQSAAKRFVPSCIDNFTFTVDTSGAGPKGDLRNDKQRPRQ